jgi:hypothetical protein
MGWICILFPRCVGIILHGIWRLVDKTGVRRPTISDRCQIMTRRICSWTVICIPLSNLRHGCYFLTRCYPSNDRWLCSFTIKGMQKLLVSYFMHTPRYDAIRCSQLDIEISSDTILSYLYFHFITVTFLAPHTHIPPSTVSLSTTSHRCSTTAISHFDSLIETKPHSRQAYAPPCCLRYKVQFLCG